MLFTVPGEYAIRALTYLADTEPGRPISIAAIAKGADVPQKFLAKLLLQLKQQGVVRAVKGPGGGYLLHRAADQVTLREVANIFQNASAKGCILGLNPCSDEHPCPLHGEWRRLRRELEDKIRNLTIAEIHQRLIEKQAHLKNKESSLG